MTPAARVQAAIELLDLVIAAARADGAPADRIVTEWFRSRRFAGSSDRRAVRELLFRAIRACGEIPPDGRAGLLLLAKDDPALAVLFDGSRHGPAPIDADEPVATPGVAPAWLESRLTASDIAGDEAAALLQRAPLDLRVNRLKAARDVIELPEPAEPTLAPGGLRLVGSPSIEHWPQFQDGLIEVQDTASQLVCAAVAAKPGETVIDLCAGAGGKTLALAADMENRGLLIASDTDRSRLSRLPPRAERAGATVIDTLLLNPPREAEALAPWEGRADAVLVDAPCSGSGTWRRNPEARWRLMPERLERIEATQRRILDIAAPLVRPGGRLVYAVCSLLDAEGADQVSAFLERHPGWQVEPIAMPAGMPRGSGLRLTPYHDGTDGFFVARLLRSC